MIGYYTIKKLKRYEIDKILSNTIYNFDNSQINIEGVRSSRAKQFSTRYIKHKH